MKFLFLCLLFPLALPSTLAAQPKSQWRSATPAELEAALPARAPVVKERIETEMRTASGIFSSQGKIIAGVVLITAGYSADGKYSHYILIQAPITIGSLHFVPGAYVLGWQRNDSDSLLLKFYDAATGVQRGTAIARHLPTGSRVESFRIWPPSDHEMIQIGRFAVPYKVSSQ